MYLLLSFRALEIADWFTELFIADSMPDDMVASVARSAFCSCGPPKTDVGLVEMGETGENTGDAPVETGEAMFGDPPPPALPVIIAVDD